MPDVQLVAQRVCRATFCRKDGNDIPIFIDAQEIGSLCPLAGETKEISALTDYQRASLDLEKTAENQQYLGAEYQFEHDYVVIRSEWLDEYNKYADSSSFWGEYCHENHLPQVYKDIDPEPPKIVINQLLNIRTTRHRDAIAKSAIYQSPIDKFLFLYHCLEIDFDYRILDKIRNLDDDNPSELGAYVRELRLDDIDRIRSIVDSVSVSVLEPWILKIKSHAGVAKKIFYEFGKDSNPIKEFEDFDKLIIQSSAISKEEFDNIKSKKKIIHPIADYEKTIRRGCSYWIYRIRCCIAHNKIGDYHMQTKDDFAFVANFGIPLIKEVVGTVFKKPI